MSEVYAENYIQFFFDTKNFHLRVAHSMILIDSKKVDPNSERRVRIMICNFLQRIKTYVYFLSHFLAVAVVVFVVFAEEAIQLADKWYIQTQLSIAMT